MENFVFVYIINIYFLIKLIYTVYNIIPCKYVFMYCFIIWVDIIRTFSLELSAIPKIRYNFVVFFSCSSGININCARRSYFNRTNNEGNLWDSGGF